MAQYAAVCCLIIRFDAVFCSNVTYTARNLPENFRLQLAGGGINNTMGTRRIKAEADIALAVRSDRILRRVAVAGDAIVRIDIGDCIAGGTGFFQSVHHIFLF